MGIKHAADLCYSMFPLRYIRMHRGLVERYLRVYTGQWHGLRETKLLAILPSEGGRIPGHFHFLLICVSVVLAFCHVCIVFVNKTNIGDDLQENTLSTLSFCLGPEFSQDGCATPMLWVRSRTYCP